MLILIPINNTGLNRLTLKSLGSKIFLNKSALYLNIYIMYVLKCINTNIVLGLNNQSKIMK